VSQSEATASARCDYDPRLVLVRPVDATIELAWVVPYTAGTIWEIEDDSLDELLSTLSSSRCKLSFKARDLGRRVYPGAGGLTSAWCSRNTSSQMISQRRDACNSECLCLKS